MTTASSEKEASSLANRVVRARLAACVNVIPRVQSRYWWNGKVQNSRETLLMIKTSGTRLKALCQRLQQLHSYEVPEILALRIASGSAAYLHWLQNALQAEKH